jgi:hypothetical protein
MDTIKSIVEGDMALLKPHIAKHKGSLPPMMFFHFETIDKRMEEMNETTDGDIMAVKNGFYVPLTNQSIMKNNEIFMEFMATVMATLTHVGIAGDLKAVVLSASGEGTKMDAKTNKVDGSGEMFLVSGMGDDDTGYTIAKEVRARLGKDNLIHELVDSDFLKEVDSTDKTVMLDEKFFPRYKHLRDQLPEDKNSFGIIADGVEDHKNDPAQFAADMIDAAIHATILFDQVKTDN